MDRGGLGNSHNMQVYFPECEKNLVYSKHLGLHGRTERAGWLDDNSESMSGTLR